MKTKGLVLDPRRYRTSVAPPDALEDTSRFGNDGTFGAGAEAPTWVQLPSGLWVLNFDGGDVITLNDNYIGAATNLTGNFTILQWISPNSIPVSDPTSFTSILKGVYNTSGYWFWPLYTGAPIVTRLLTSQAAAAQNKLSNQWVAVINTFYLVGVTLSGGAVSFYLNGIANGGGGAAVTPPATTAVATIIGRFGAGAYETDGKLVTKIYNYALSDAQIYSIFNSERSLFGV